MTDAIADGENEAFDDDEEYGPSMAMPPLYVLRATARCPECGQAQHVYALGCAAFHDGEDLRPLEDFHFLRLVRSVPEPVLTMLRTRCPSYYLDRADPEEAAYLMNHCRCGARLDDDYVNGDIGAAFWPDTPEGYGTFTLFRLPLDEAIPVECSIMLGGGEYLDLANARPWTEL
jgi:hypothetical protein